MNNEGEDQRIAKTIIGTMALMFFCITSLVLLLIWMPKFFNGPVRRLKPILFPEDEISMTERVLWEKYGEEFIVHNTRPNSSSEFFANCSPASNEEVVFLAAVWKDGSGVVYDYYLQSILANKLEKEMEEELRKYYDSVFVKVYTSYTYRADKFYEEVSSIQDVTMEEYITRFHPLWCRIDIGIDAEEGNDHLEEEYAFYERIQEKVGDEIVLPFHVAYYNMDAELQEWCNNYFTRNATAYGTYTSKRSKCNKMELECTVEGVSVTYDEFKTMREELGKDE